MSKTALYPGTFDPFTNGHLDMVQRGLKLFDGIVIAVAENPKKEPLFDINERVSMIREAVRELEGVSVEPFHGLMVDFAKEMGVSTTIRGLRAVSDFEFELQLALMNRKLDRSIDTVFLMPSLRYIFLTSTIVKEAALYGGSVTGLVPENVERELKRKFSGNKG